MRRVVCATVDLDPLRVYLENRGLEPARRSLENCVHDRGLRRFLELFEAHGIPATFFVVGRDVPANAPLLREAVASGHELASHGLTHRLDLASAGADVLAQELAETEELLGEYVGVRARGFRAPGWNVSRALFDQLWERGYRYDSSLLPLPGVRLLSWLPRLAPRWSGPAILRGQRRWGRPPAHPYPVDPERPWIPATDSEAPHRLWEVPCGVSAGIPLPLSSTVRALLGGVAGGLVETLAARSPGPLVLVFHGIDLVDCGREIRDPRLAGKPGLTDPLEVKLRRVEGMLKRLGRGRTWMRLTDLVEQWAG